MWVDTYTCAFVCILYMGIRDYAWLFKLIFSELAKFTFHNQPF